jgi:hypothetical protein
MTFLRKFLTQAVLCVGSLATIPSAQAGMSTNRPWLIITSDGATIDNNRDLISAVVEIKGYENAAQCLVAKGRYMQAFDERHVSNVMVVCAYVPGLPQ